MLRNTIPRSLSFASRQYFYTTGRRAFASARATQARTASPAVFAAAFATPFIGYLAYTNVAHADDKEEEVKESTPAEEEPSFLKNEVIDLKDVKTNTTLLNASEVVADATEVVTSAATEAAEITEEEAAANQGAFNPETGEINWDCPCLGGMANGPCGEEFKAAFSCFVYSEADPKGIDCVEKFQGMQDCFRRYPEVYSEELREDAPLDSVEGDSAPSTEGETASTEAATPSSNSISESIDSEKPAASA
ncbi:Mia40p [Sugiyamaella lignohabitans]|uniref:Mitochondrial intermembrane space import and assembly protein 40 n=1 Tax=Sugiyamaella lignohabitans TaxID=796027 RepID=A0A161HMT3_9ASCO|nr:Mia40p [Sugiyamaella lignohabitans]ANB15227.1 Mia40p [Sugiyamaella lignohabitans]